jgi:hypothetical protein
MYLLLLLLTVMGASSEPAECPNLLQLHQSAKRVTAESCSPLQNHGSYSTVQVKVGTPSQTFNLVADTGSDDVIVQSCQCQEEGNCPREFGKCFDEKSTSFLLDSMQSGHDKGPAEVLMSFGSGDIAAVISSDIVQVGDVSAFMKESLLLMMNQELSFSGMFEGILGLGRPTPQVLMQEEEKEKDPGSKILPFFQVAQVDRFSLCFNYNADGVLALNTPEQPQWLGSVGEMHWGLDFQGISVGDETSPAFFCLPQDKKPGQQTACGIIPDSGTTLIMGPQHQLAQLYDKICSQWDRCNAVHLMLTALLKNESQDLVIELIKDQRDLIPSSLETKITNVRDLLHTQRRQHRHKIQKSKNQTSAKLLGTKKQHEDDLVRKKYLSATHLPRKHETFQFLLQKCSSWLNESTDLNSEMPQIFFQVAGLKSGNDSLALDPLDYVIETTQEVAHKHTKEILGMFPVTEISETEEVVCMPAFGVLDYPTTLNGPVWIFGTPLFFAYDVNYNRASSPPGMFFSRDACGSCQDGQVSDKEEASLLQRRSTDRPRKVTGEFLTKKINTTKPL